MRKHYKKFLAMILAMAMTLSIGGTALAAQVTGTEDPTVSVSLDGEDVELKDANGTELDPVMIGGSTYLPIRAIAEALGLGVNWDGANNEVQLTAPNGTAAPAATSKAAVPAVVHLTGNGKFGFGEGYLLGYEDNGVYTFKNIKYGNAERFKHSVPNTEYGTAANPSFAMNNGPVAPQGDTMSASRKGFGNAAIMTPSDSDMFSIEADCLNLNVWTNNMNSGAKKPVLVFFHGGGFVSGSSIELKSYNGNYFADYTDVVFVSVNTRLNLLGYRDLSAIGGDGNLALSDMILSLEWVKDNIAQFGGDPDNVTILGQSGGGRKVTALSSSPKALKEDLFQNVVVVSGMGSYGAEAATPEVQAEGTAAAVASVKASDAFAAYLMANGNEIGLNITDSSTMGDLKKLAQNASDEVIFHFLQTTDYDTLVDLGLGDRQYSNSYTADGEYFDKAGILLDPETLTLNETARNYTYMIGVCWAESDMLSSDAGIMLSDPTRFVSNMSDAQQKAFMESWLEDRVGNYDETKAAFEKAFPDHIFYDLYAGASRINMADPRCEAMAKQVNGDNQVYYYLSAYTVPMFGGLAMVHTLDLTYFFHSIETAPWQIHGDMANAQKVADTMASSLAAFCANGDPSIPGLKILPITDTQTNAVIYDVNSRCVSSDFNADLLALIAKKDA